MYNAIRTFARLNFRLTPCALSHVLSNERKCGINFSHSSHASGELMSSISSNAPQTSDTDNRSQSRYVSSFLAASCIMNSIKSCIHNEGVPSSDRRSISDKLWSFCRAVWKFSGEVIRVTSEWNSMETGGASVE